uniref:C2H2-type domain-containing protein n=1 Tax=Chromera velia CCMP2878 TaxID=1169474 RepID=A0A0G4F1V9_9ALVE|eukprot:Cvel_14664.t1-p1 / transcript=Cvel_14664.t1 / gene=Cvel_14664 / organism=Chromera_velia_CCMP2878 / gene_product=Zinc finger protein 593, putative / transcript_product=Zinc finger protein 593, putative / location=Cvel_scaffold1051:23203-26669(+) / protein_length=153 / sequence_SO=supercontig / SO=protein_coding / is_pseudo=false
MARGRRQKKATRGTANPVKRNHDLKRRKKDMDQIHEEMKNPPKLVVDEDLPGRGMHYCIPCARYFESREVLEGHAKTKTHKKRLKESLQDPYTQRDAEEAAEMTHERPRKSGVAAGAAAANVGTAVPVGGPVPQQNASVQMHSSAVGIEMTDD